MKNLLLVLSILILFSCSKKQHSYSDEQVIKFKQDFSKFIDENNKYYKTNENSPLLEKDKLDFTELEYYDYNPNFRFEGPIHTYENPDTIIIYGSKNDERPSIRYGYFEFVYDNENHKLQLFKIISKKPGAKDYLFLGFTDETTNKTTYGAGRYINVELNDENHYIIDFNYAYNPYCAYNSKYSCAIPPRENHLDIAIEAGEKKYHD